MFINVWIRLYGFSNKITIYFLIKSHQCKEGTYADFGDIDYKNQISEIVREKALYAKPKETWDKVKAVRSVDRASALDYIEVIFDKFVESHGDRAFRDDPAIVAARHSCNSSPSQ